MVKENSHLIVASAMLFSATTAGALTVPFGVSSLYSDAISITSEPASILMLGMGLAAVFVRRLHVVQAEKQKK